MISLAALVLTSRSALAQQNTQAPPPVRPLGPIVAVTKDSLLSATTALPMRGGRVMMMDMSARRVVLYDSALANATVVADSASDAPNAYGNRQGTLLSYHGDSALLITPGSMSMLVLSPEGKIVRTMAMPSSQNVLALLGNIFGTPGFDAQGRLVYFNPNRFNINQTRGGGAQPPTGPIVMEPPDSATVVRFDFATRALDTAASIRIPKNRNTMTRSDNGSFSSTMTAFPPQTVDGWTVTPDGGIAVVRGRDYHVDWLAPDGKWTSTPRMPYEWERLNDDEKNALLDSTATTMQVTMDSMRAKMERQMNGSNGNGTATVSSGGGDARTGGGGGSMTIITRSEGGPPGGGPPRAFTMPKVVVTRAALSDVPDYRPPMPQGAVSADVSGNLWIRTNLIKNDRPVYDIVNRRGEVTDRVQLPANRTIAGFGPGVVYLAVFDSLRVAHLEKALVRPLGMVAGQR